MDSTAAMQIFLSEEDGNKSELDSDDERHKEEKLFTAIRKGKLQKMKDLLDKGVKTNIVNRNNKNNTPLHYAVEKGQTDIVRELLHEKWNTPIDEQNSNGDTPLHTAASKSNKELVLLLVSKQAKTDVENNKGQIPRDVAGDVETARILERPQKLLLREENFVKIDVPSDGSCLFWATALAYLTPVRYNNNLFRERCEKLFGGVHSAELIKQIQLLFQRYDPYIYNTDIFNNQMLKYLVREVFRRRIIEEILLHQGSFEDTVTINDILHTKNEDYVIKGTLQKQFCDKFSSEIKENVINVDVLKPKTFDEIAVHVIDNELEKVHDHVKLKEFKFEAYLGCMCDPKAWGGNQEIQAISQLLHCSVHVFSDGAQYTFSSNNSWVNVQLFNNGESHYTFGVIRAQVLIELMKSNKLQFAEMCCTFGVDNVNYSNDDWTPLHLAAREGNTHIFQLLLAQCGSIDAKNCLGQIPLDVAKLSEKDCVINLLNEYLQEGGYNDCDSTYQSFVQKQSSRRDINPKCWTDEINSEISPPFKQKHVEVDFDVTDKGRSSLEEMQAGVENRIVLDNQNYLASNQDFEKKWYKKGGTVGIKGGIYQVKLLMLFLYRALEKQYSFCLATEMDAAEKFDDLVFEYISSNQKIYRFLQAKHKEDESQKINANHLLTVDPSDFSLLKYFNSYRRISKKSEYQDGIIKDFIICTNITFKFDDSEELKLKDALEKMECRDDILHVKCKGKEPICYQFKNTFCGEEKVYQVLRRASDLTRLAKQLAQCVLYNKLICHHQDESIFKSYNVALAKEVIDVKNKTFKNNFLNVCSEESCEFLDKLRHAFEEEIKIEVQQCKQLRHTKMKAKKMCFSLDSERNLLEQIKEKKIKLQLSKGFGESTENQKVLPNDEVTESEMKSFMKHLVFAVNQPNEVELGEIIKNELGKEFNNIDKKNIYSRFLEEILDWMKEKDGRFVTHVEGKSFFEKVKVELLGTVWFNVKEPVTLFSGRKEELKELHHTVQRCNNYTVISQITSICGLGGIGKTELARKYVHDYCDDYDGNVVWINAEKHETLVESFLNLARDIRLSIPTKCKDGKEKKIESIVKEIYMFFAKRKSIFVFDNAEGSDYLPPFLPLWFLKPTDNKPYILITSREKEWESGIEVIALKELKLEDSVDFVKKGLNIKNVSKLQEVKDLVIKLQFFPLAMQQAVAYIRDQRETGKFEISDYLKKYDRKTAVLLSSTVFKGIDNDYAKTTFTTWKMTIDKIRSIKEDGELALKILNVVAYMEPCNIDRDMLLNLTNGSEKKKRKKVRSAVRLLVKYSMLNSDQEQSSLNIHRLVQEVMRLELQAQGIEQETLREVLDLIKTDVKKWLNHTICAWGYAVKYKSLIVKFSPLSSLVTQELQEGVRYNEAFLFAQKAAALLKKMLGDDHPCTIRINHNLAEVLDYLGYYDRAFKIFQEVLVKSKKIFGPDHPETLSTMHDLALVLMEKGKYEESLELYEEVLEKEKRNMRHNKPEVLVTMQNVAAVYCKLERDDKALEIYEEALSRAVQILGPNDRDTLMIRNNRASVLHRLGKYDDALNELCVVLDKRQCILGLDHPDTFYTMHDIAAILMDKKQYDEALKIFQNVRDKTEKILGPNHPDILTPLDSIAATLVNQQKYDEAMEVYQQVLDKKIKILGPDHPDTISTMSNRAKALSKQGKHEKSFKAYEEVLEKQKKNLGPYHADTIKTESMITGLFL